jgi:hypothetical protein
MITTPHPITYQELLARHERIRIPRLQRDYAQGRSGPKETDVRKGFLEVLRTALERTGDAGFTPLNLDFVYGSAESEPDNHFSPLDGQQRLTTLFLVHWLLAWRDGEESWRHFSATFRDAEGRSRFSYDVRTSSRDFFNELVAHRPPMTEAAGARFSLKTWIIDQPWYFQYWRLDPTVQGVLAMLDEMHRHALFRLRPGMLYGQLTNSERPAITFQLLNLGDFRLSDDLYIKMNARGKPLTAFETFKARYETKLRDHFPDSTRRTICTAAFSMHEFIPRRLDTAWTDFFWTYHKDAGPLVTQRVDESFMNLFRMVALVTRDPTKDKGNYWLDIETLRSEENPPTYSAFESRRWLDSDFSALLVSLLESWCATRLPLSAGGLFDEPALLRQLFLDPAGLTVPQVVLFCGYALFVHKHEGQFQPEELSEWMRIVHNLGYNSEIDRNDRVQNAAKGLSELLPHSRSILAHIAKLDRQTGITGFARDQQREEALKAGLLLADSEGWRPLIDQAERHGYFRGQIGFLLKFSGVTAEWERTGDCAWAGDIHARLQSSFRAYLAKAEMMFDAKGLIDLGENEERWTRALLGLGDYLLENGSSSHSFLVNDASKPFSWKRLLRDDDEQRDLLKRLWDHPTFAAPLVAGLDAIIQSASGMEPWREALVRNAEAIRYCEQRNIQHSGDNHVILLMRKKRSAPHAELVTFLLHPRLQPPSPFTKGDYFERDEPHIPLHFPWRDEPYSLGVYGRDGFFELWVNLQLPCALGTLLEEGGGFTTEADFPDWLMRPVPHSDLDRTLGEIAYLLTVP